MKKILFVCVENACRSQMAAAFFKKELAGWTVGSAGSAPADKLDPLAAEAMREKCIDISANKPKKFTPEMGTEYDYIVTMGCGGACPITSRNKTIVWDIEDPRGKPIEKYRQVRDKIAKEAKELGATLRN